MDLNIKFSELAEMNESAIFETDYTISAVSTDTRHIDSGDTFVAIDGEHFDGHDFIEDAISNGAGAIVSSRNIVSDIPVLMVRNTVEALGNIASVFRNRYQGMVVGITGSNGKTTVKEMLKSIFEQSLSVSATTANNNNKIGVPLTVLSANPDDPVWLVEMGTSEKGEIPYLADMIHPNISVITSISESHLAGFGAKQDVFEEKSAIFRGMKNDGIAVMNHDSPWFEQTKEMFKTSKIVSFGLDSRADCHCDYESHADGFSVHASSNGRILHYKLKVPGEHNVINSLAAVAVAQALGVSDEDIVLALESFSGVKGRMEVKVLPVGTTLINDSYNASPASVKAAIQSLGLYKGRKLFVFGGMAELGDKSDSFHADVGVQAMQYDVDSLYVLGEAARPAYDAYSGEKFYAQDMQQLLDKLGENVLPDDVVLIKGSRAFRMERVAEHLEENRR
jgi:UDP-N-acetylmuramoyl-tripeptide--D-alanyl-D-alanine ligase